MTLITESKSIYQSNQAPAIIRPEEISDERKIIEIAKCAQSFPYYLKNYVKTRDTQGKRGVQPFPQWEYLMTTARAFEIYDQIGIEKSRQLVLTWLVSAYLGYLCMWSNGEEVLNISRRGLYSRETGLRAQLILNNLPEWMQQPYKTNSKWGEYYFPMTESRFFCLSAEKDTGRSFSPSAMIFDEHAFFPFGSLVMAALGPLMEEGVKFISLSTPNGQDPNFYPLMHPEKPDLVHRIYLWWYQRPGRDAEWFRRLRMRPGMTKQRINREYLHSYSTPEGKPVYEDFSEYQVKECYSQYNPNKPLIRGFDRGFDDPAFCIGQINDDDQLLIYHSEKGTKIGRRRWLKHVQDVCKAKFKNHRGGYIDYAATDFKKPEAEGYEDAWNQVMKEYGINIEQTKKDDVNRRVTATRERMGLREDRKFGIIIDPQGCSDPDGTPTEHRSRYLLEGLRGGYCYPDKPGFQGDLKPLKNDFSHEANCLEHICDNHFKAVGKGDNYKTYFMGAADSKKKAHPWAEEVK